MPDVATQQLDYPRQMSAAEFYDIRCDLGLTQKQLAAILGCHEITVIKYENGHSPIPAGKANHLRLALSTHAKGRS